MFLLLQSCGKGLGEESEGSDSDEGAKAQAGRSAEYELFDVIYIEAIQLIKRSFEYIEYHLIDVLCYLRGCALDGGHHHASSHARRAMSNQSLGNAS